MSQSERGGNHGDETLPLRYVMPGVVIVVTIVAWTLVTSNRVSYRVFDALVVLAVPVAAANLWGRRWWSTLVAMAGATAIFAGSVLGGLSGILLVIVGADLLALAAVSALVPGQATFAMCWTAPRRPSRRSTSSKGLRPFLRRRA